MNKNEVFQKFLQNPLLKEKTGLSETRLKTMNLSSSSSDRLIDVIKTTILHLEDSESVDTVARKINQSFKRETI
jgi:hypothetical protein